MFHVGENYLFNRITLPIYAVINDNAAEAFAIKLCTF